MNDPLKPGKRYIFIALLIILMGTGVYIAGESLSGEAIAETPTFSQGGSPDYAPIEKEEGVFTFSQNQNQQISLTGAGQQVRDLKTFYSRRAYPGAPPMVPHPVLFDMDEEKRGNSCLGCHNSGGYVEALNAYAPITPHPQKENCRQCHVPEMTNELFRDIDWASVDPPKTGQSALAGSPPPIPHFLQMRENCLSCHGGAAAIKKIKTGHPERVNCRQCHAASYFNE